MTIKTRIKYFIKNNKYLNKIYLKQLYIRYELGIIEQPFHYKMLKGDGIEVGAMSSPAIFKSMKTIKYADIKTVDKLQESIKEIKIKGLYEDKYVDVDYIIPENDSALFNVQSNSVDFVFSSHSFEHAPNPVDSFIDYYRVIKDNGVVYTIIPNKNNTYDRKRIDTPIKKLVKKWRDKNYSYTLDEFHEVYKNTIGHPLYYKRKDEEIKKSWEENSGLHHIYVYSEKNTLELITFLTSVLKGSELVYFNSGWDIHFAIKKNPTRSYGKTKAEKQFNKNIF